MSGNPPQRGEVYSITNGYRIKVEHHQNATGKWQCGLTYQSNDEDLAIENAIKKTKLYIDGMRDAGLIPVDPKDPKEPKKSKEVKSDG